jgi:hypothetical protein
MQESTLQLFILFCLDLFYFILFFVVLGNEPRALYMARQVLCLLSHAPSPPFNYLKGIVMHACNPSTWEAKVGRSGF